MQLKNHLPRLDLQVVKLILQKAFAREAITGYNCFIK
jgi:hypothetical protein